MALTSEIARLSTDERLRVVLTCDPDIRDSNDAAALRRYLETGDVGGLVVPDGATVLTIRPLSRLELDACEDRASEVRGARRSVRGARLLAGMVGGGEVLPDITDDDADALRAHARWAESRAVEVCRAGLVDAPDEVVGLLDRAPDVSHELALHIERASTLPKARLSR